MRVAIVIRTTCRVILALVLLELAEGPALSCEPTNSELPIKKEEHSHEERPTGLSGFDLAHANGWTQISTTTTTTTPPPRAVVVMEDQAALLARLTTQSPIIYRHGPGGTT
jgi:hypothetical protein